MLPTDGLSGVKVRIMKVEVEVSKLHPDAAADLICERLANNNDRAAAQAAGDSWAIGPGHLTSNDVWNTVHLLLTEQRHLLNDENEEWLRRFAEAY